MQLRYELTFSVELVTMKPCLMEQHSEQTVLTGSDFCGSQIRPANPHIAVSSTFDSRTIGPGFDIQSGHILLFLLPLIQEWQLSVIGEIMCN